MSKRIALLSVTAFAALTLAGGFVVPAIAQDKMMNR
jgi:hypothetical protein